MRSPHCYVTTCPLAVLLICFGYTPFGILMNEFETSSSSGGFERDGAGVSSPLPAFVRPIRTVQPSLGHRGSGGPSRRRIGVAASISLGVAAIMVLAGLDLNVYGANVGPTASGVQLGTATSGSGTVCSRSSRLPSSLDILTPNPTEGYPVGATISAGYEYGVVNYTASNLNESVSVPVVQALFPTAGGSDLSVTVSPHTSSINGSGWSSEESTSSAASSSNYTFSTTTKAQFATEGFYTASPVSDAVQATAPYGNLTLEFRWQWQLTEPNGSVYTGPWTVPTYASADPALPSIFYPAPMVTSSSMMWKVAMGTNFTDNLTGYAANTTFTLSFQTTAGTVLGTYYLRTPTSGTGPFAASIPIIASSGELAQGWYIFHVQNRCGALVQDHWFDVVYSPFVNVGITVSPSACGRVVWLNGTSYSSGSSVKIRPSATAWTLSASSCSGSSFAGWKASGGVVPVSSSVNRTSLLVSYGGNITASFGGSNGVTFSELNLTKGDVWNVTLNGLTHGANASQTITFTEPNGTFSYSVGSNESGLATPSHGSITFSGSAVNATITFSTMNITHVVVIVMENSELGTVLSYAPYMNYLWQTYGRASQYYPVCHPSVPDYTVITSGRYYECGGWVNESAARNLPDVLQSAGLTWGGYFESMPKACDRTWDGTIYDASHNPFLVSEDIVNNATRCDAHDVNSAAFNQSVANGTLPSFSMYIPNTQDDCEYSTLKVCDKWLHSFLPPMLNSTSPAVEKLMNHTAFIIAFDEGLTYNGYSIGGIKNGYCFNSTGKSLTVCGGHTYLSIVSPYSHGSVYSLNATGFNIATTIEWLLGVGNAGGYDGSAYFPAMESLFWPT